MFDIDIIERYAYLGKKWAPPAPVWWAVCGYMGGESLHVFTEIP